MDKRKKISIITVCLNSSKTLQNCINSVRTQNYPKSKIEHIIIDGSSEDGTLEIIKKNKRYLSYWESKKDRGIYHAINKGIRKSTGEIIGILNSDDFYYKETFKIVNKYFKKKEIDFLFGSVHHKNLYHGFYPQKYWYKFNIYPAHSVGFFIKKKIQNEIGFYSTKFQYSSDRDLIFRLIKYGYKGIATKKKEVFGRFDPNGISSKLSFYVSLFEEIKIRFSNKQNILFLFILIVVKILYKFWRVLFHK